MVLSATASAKDMQTLRRISYLARQDRTEAGEVTFVQGRVPRSLDRNDERPPYRVGDRVILGDFIRTGFGDTLEILLDINARLHQQCCHNGGVQAPRQQHPHLAPRQMRQLTLDGLLEKGLELGDRLCF